MTLVPNRDQSTLEKRGFSGRLILTRSGVLVRCQVAERAVRSALIVVDAPRFDLCFGILDRRELVDVQTFVSERRFRST